MTPKITAIIPTFNEKDNIVEAVKSCQFADEIIVVDSFSTDGTLDLVKDIPKVRTLSHEYINSAAQKNWTIPQAKHEWIFLLDADERVDKELEKEILKTVQNPKHSAYWIKRSNYFMDKKLNFVWKGDAVIRLFKKDDCKYEEKHVHAEIISKGTIGRLPVGELIHDTYKHKGLESHVIKNYRYSTWAAYDRVNKIEKITMYHLMVKPLFAFFKRYILQGGIFDGRQGFIVSMFGMWSVFLRNVKIWRMHQGEKIEAK